MKASQGKVTIIGGGLAGCEAAWQVARHGIRVDLVEMRPERMTEAHRTGLLAELVCSNSFKSDSISNAVGLLKVELRMLGSLLLEIATRTRVPAGGALCVDRKRFAEMVTEAIEEHPLITVERKEATRVEPGRVTIVAAGPLASKSLTEVLERIVGARNLYFYDAISPIVEGDSIDMSVVFKSSRYAKGDSTYLNIPLNRDQYMDFVNALRNAEVVPKHPFEEDRFFSACMPIEELARMGDDTLAHGCMKPVGLVDPRTGKIPYAVVQLRPENLEGTLYGMVGFQTRLKHGEQKRIFRMLPGLERARFARLGSIHRNTYLNSPAALLPTLEHREIDGLMFAGQITGAEGYVAAIGTGLLAGLNAARKVLGLDCVVPPRETILGGLARYIAGGPLTGFNPMNPNFGLVPTLGIRIRNRLRRNLLLAERSVEAMRAWSEQLDLQPSPLDG